MLDPEKIAHYLSRFRELSLEDLMGIMDLFVPRRLSVGEVYIRKGAVQDKIAYIKKGMIRVFSVKPSGEEVTVLLRWEDQFFSSYDATLLHQPSRFIYQAIEETELLETDYSVLMDYLDNTPTFARVKHYFLLEMLAESMVRVESFILLTPEERYLKLIRDKQDIVQRVHDKYIATFLGITPVSLSRIRKRIAGRPA
ncbi:Crp/Fnr family transcriptional regulator [Flavitalea flava]